MGDELTSFDVKACGDALREHALKEFLARSTSTDAFIRNWLGAYRPRTGTPRTEMEQAVRYYLGDDRWSPTKRVRSTVQPVGFADVGE
jgi:hypothetical protein